MQRQTGPAARQRRQRARQAAARRAQAQIVASPPRRPAAQAQAPRNAGPARTRNSIPVAFSTPQRRRAPQVTNGNGGKTRVRHTERIATVFSSVDFSVRTFPVNPGLRATFPWLARMAQRYESYKFHRLTFAFRTKTSTVQVGDVILTMDYDALDAPPLNGKVAEAYEGAISSSPWQDINWHGKAEDMQKFKSHFVRSNSVPQGGDRKTYDIGNFFVCTENQPAPNVLLGYIYVTYDVEFCTPQLNVGEDVAGIDAAASSSQAGSVSTDPFYAFVPGPFTPNPIIANQLDVAFTTTRSFEIFRPGNFVMTYTATLRNSAPTVPETNVYTVTATEGATFNYILNEMVATSTGTSVIDRIIVQLLLFQESDNSTYTFAWTTAIPLVDIGVVDVFVAQLPQVSIAPTPALTTSPPARTRRDLRTEEEERLHQQRVESGRIEPEQQRQLRPSYFQPPQVPPYVPAAPPPPATAIPTKQ